MDPHYYAGSQHNVGHHGEKKVLHQGEFAYLPLKAPHDVARLAHRQKQKSSKAKTTPLRIAPYFFTLRESPLPFRPKGERASSPGRSSGSWILLLFQPSHPIISDSGPRNFVPTHSGGTAPVLTGFPLQPLSGAPGGIKLPKVYDTSSTQVKQKIFTSIGLLHLITN